MCVVTAGKDASVIRDEEGVCVPAGDLFEEEATEGIHGDGCCLVLVGVVVHADAQLAARVQSPRPHRGVVHHGKAVCAARGYAQHRVACEAFDALGVADPEGRPVPELPVRVATPRVQLPALCHCEHVVVPAANLVEHSLWLWLQ